MLADLIAEFRRYERLAQGALAELDEASFFKRPAPHANSTAVIVKHVAGNLVSRFTDFLTSDGEKPLRHRDGEFQIADGESREKLMAAWESAWRTLYNALESLADGDVDRVVLIRGEAHTVGQAIVRSLAHTSYHIGQVLYLVRMLCPQSKWLTVPPGQSGGFPGQYLKSPEAQR